jgi:hypothetical protein
MLCKSCLAGIGTAGILAISAWHYYSSSSTTPEIAYPPKSSRVETAPLCPWREPDRDLREFFADSLSEEGVRYETETRILSGRRVELAERLGRIPSGEENVLSVHRVLAQQRPVGFVLTRRVKGEYGAIEIVLATHPTGEVRGLRLQRLREPDSIAAMLEQREWLGAFRGKTAASPLQLGGDIPAVPPPAGISAAAIVDGVRTLLILFETSERGGVPTVGHRH